MNGLWRSWERTISTRFICSLYNTHPHLYYPLSKYKSVNIPYPSPIAMDDAHYALHPLKKQKSDDSVEIYSSNQHTTWSQNLPSVMELRISQNLPPRKQRKQKTKENHRCNKTKITETSMTPSLTRKYGTVSASHNTNTSENTAPNSNGVDNSLILDLHEPETPDI